MIRFIQTKDTLPLRSLVLRGGANPELCRFDGDDDESSFHLGYFEGEELICIASFHQIGHERFKATGTGFQLRGMATAPEYQGKGIGNRLLNFAIIYLRGQKAAYLWCNARKLAYRFYLSLGFEFISEEFEMAGIGTHRAMYLKIR